MKKFILTCVLTILIFSMQVKPSVSAYRVGDKVGNFTLTDLSGNSVTLFDFKNKVILLNFFATW